MAKHYNYLKMARAQSKSEVWRKIAQFNLSTVKEAPIGVTNPDFMVELTKANCLEVEKQIGKDPAYPDYIKAAAHWYSKNSGGKFPRTDCDAVRAMIRLIDYVYSTQASTKNPGAIEDMADYISKTPLFWSRLRQGDPTLVDDLLSQQKQNKKSKSLASKVCKVFASAILGNEDLYFVNDSVVRRALPFYTYQYLSENHSFKEIDGMSYDQLHALLSRLQNKINQGKAAPVTKHELDRLIWYVYK